MPIQYSLSITRQQLSKTSAHRIRKIEIVILLLVVSLQRSVGLVAAQPLTIEYCHGRGSLKLIQIIKRKRQRRNKKMKVKMKMSH